MFWNHFHNILRWVHELRRWCPININQSHNRLWNRPTTASHLPTRPRHSYVSAITNPPSPASRKLAPHIPSYAVSKTAFAILPISVIPPNYPIKSSSRASASHNCCLKIYNKPRGRCRGFLMMLPNISKIWPIVTGPSRNNTPANSSSTPH